MIDTSTPEGRAKRIAQIDRQHHTKLVKLYDKALKEGNVMKAHAIGEIRHSLYGEGDYRSGNDWGNEPNNNQE